MTIRNKQTLNYHLEFELSSCYTILTWRTNVKIIKQWYLIHLLFANKRLIPINSSTWSTVHFYQSPSGIMRMKYWRSCFISCNTYVNNKSTLRCFGICPSIHMNYTSKCFYGSASFIKWFSCTHLYHYHLHLIRQDQCNR